MRSWFIASVLLVSLVPAHIASAQVPVALALAARDVTSEGDPQTEIRRRFPSDQFIVGQGLIPGATEADGKARSQQAAMADISDQLENLVQHALEIRSSESERRASRTTSAFTKTSSSALLKNVQYQLGCYRAASGQYQTWATLNKRDAVSSAQAALVELNDRGQRLQAEASAAQERPHPRRIAAHRRLAANGRRGSAIS